MKLAKLDGKPEIFYTIQGEGKSVGKPSIFVRTSLCNLHCIWCDTDYTWNWENTPFETRSNIKFKKEDYLMELDPEEIVSQILSYPCKHVVLTGGEPLMQQEGLLSVIQLLKKHDSDYTFEMETNGTLVPRDELSQLIDQFNVSPKLANSNNEVKIREKPAALTFFSANDKSVFKFVLNHNNDLEEVLKLIESYKIDSSKVFIMPEGTSPDTLREKQKWLIEVCKNYGFMYTDRLHIHVYGSKRGV